MLSFKKLQLYAQLMRLDKPIGIFLLLWPTLWGLWLANQGLPDKNILVIFVLGVLIMRSAGCVINDFVDRNFDLYVKRTQQRPLATQQLKPYEALLLGTLLFCCGCVLLLFCHLQTILLAFVGGLIIPIYPFMKRFTHLPQVGLGMAFAWGVPMAFAESQGVIPLSAWWVFLFAVIWTVMYDTLYAMVDRSDDLMIGIKSTAILLGSWDKTCIGFMQLLLVGLLVQIRYSFELSSNFYLCIFIVCLLFGYQQWLIQAREPVHCFKAFLNNQWVGFVIFVGILLAQ